MLKLIQQIDMAWENRDTLFKINPDACNGYFDFRNKIILKYNRKHKLREVF